MSNETPNVIRTDVEWCARCGGTHSQFEFNKFTLLPLGCDFTHWAECPISHEPVLSVEAIKAEVEG